MKMYNFEIESFGKFLADLNITNGKQSRMRTRFIRLLESQLRIIDEERIEIVKKHADKDEAGEPKYIIRDEATGQIEYIVSDKGALHQEVSELWNEEFAIDEGESIKDMLITVRNILLDYEGDLSGQNAALYDRFCEIIEGVYQN